MIRPCEVCGSSNQNPEWVKPRVMSWRDPFVAWCETLCYPCWLWADAILATSNQVPPLTYNGVPIRLEGRRYIIASDPEPAKPIEWSAFRPEVW